MKLFSEFLFLAYIVWIGGYFIERFNDWLVALAWKHVNLINLAILGRIDEDRAIEKQEWADAYHKYEKDNDDGN